MSWPTLRLHTNMSFQGQFLDPQRAKCDEPKDKCTSMLSRGGGGGGCTHTHTHTHTLSLSLSLSLSLFLSPHSVSDSKTEDPRSERQCQIMLTSTMIGNQEGLPIAKNQRKTLNNCLNNLGLLFMKWRILLRILARKFTWTSAIPKDKLFGIPSLVPKSYSKSKAPMRSLKLQKRD